MSILSVVLCLGSIFFRASAQSIKIVTVGDSSLTSAGAWATSALSLAETSTGLSIQHEHLSVSLDDENSGKEQLCSALFGSVAALLDLTAGGWPYGRDRATEIGVPYLRAQISNHAWMEAVDDLLQSRNATDAALIFSNEAELDQALYYLVGGSVVRVIVQAGVQANTTETLKKMRPSPSYYVMFGTTQELMDMYAKVDMYSLVTRDSRWTLVFSDLDQEAPFDSGLLKTTVTTVNPTSSVCCSVTATDPPCSCREKQFGRDMTQTALIYTARAVKASGRSNVKGDCSSPPSLPPSRENFYTALNTEMSDWKGAMWSVEKNEIAPDMEFNMMILNSSTKMEVGKWDTANKLELDPEYKNTPMRRYFRIGTIKSRPWVYMKDNSMDTLVIEGGSTDEIDKLDGYCVDLAQKLGDMMKFDFEFVFPKDGKYGARQPDGTWNGLVGDLASGETDLIVAPLTMTSEREEVVDFVAPYFDQSGISIVIQKRQKEESLFKFMTVLKPEVWVSIVAALVVTGIMIWLLDRYSPYSAQNNAELYPYPCRKFTLKESFWFALTSFTPQGGGEAPKALSGRTLVAAYWLFVVLMLATFTANLAAFLTVERMQTPVSSLEELATQSKINYTILGSTAVEQYFINMAAAEEELYRVWKELTLNSTSDQSKYRVWDYPIKEQYTHILQVIEDSKPVLTASEGLARVEANDKGEFAFIHDASEIRYEVYHNCKLTEVGEPFAEQPYAIAVQQGSHLQDEISRSILELQKDRYFEGLSAKFWNSSARGICENDDDSEGITLQSLGGVFIATLIGLALAMVALAVEVLYYKRGPTGSKVTDLTPSKIASKLDKDHVSRITVSPAY
ncbi:ionotropic receptor 8a isoform X2 [Oratosquilla oratoria]|uniref:ionotropic receptor 8a isoform X2 n=1 Tax=Oratosquilla oratoria TaxID=337810 RepID=UPI003F772953